MKHAWMSVPTALAALLLSGCDHGKEQLVLGADAEAAGNFAEAAAQYKAVCDNGSSFCPTATRGLERLKLAEADQALSRGEYRKAKAAIDLALVSTDEGVKRAADAMNKLPDLEAGVAWEEAAAAPKPDQVLAAMEAIAGGSTGVAPRAGEWLAKNRPQILLDRVKAACATGGVESCAELGRRLARLHPSSPESAEASKLVEADYARIFPLMQSAEGLLEQQSMLFVVREKVRWCMWDKTNDAVNLESEGSLNYMEPTESFRAPCESEVSPEPIPHLEKAWDENLAQIHDPSFTKPLAERMVLATTQGLFEREAWPKPAGKK